MDPQRIIYGRHPVAQVLRAQPETILQMWLQKGLASQSPRVQALANEALRLGTPITYTSRGAIEEMTGAQTHQGVALSVKTFAYSSIETLFSQAQAPALIVMLDGVQDPHNLGALIRSALALGAHGVIIAKDRACEVTPTAVKASAGATAHLPVARVVNLSRTLAWLKERGLWAVGTCAEGTTELWQVDMCLPTVIVVGSEGEGMRRGITKACDYVARVPITATSASLNASVAGGVCLYEAARQRQSKKF